VLDPCPAAAGPAPRETPARAYGSLRTASVPTPALVHDYLLVLRGAERVFAEMATIWPDAPIHTLLYDAEGTEHRFSDRTISTSYLQRLRAQQGGFRRLLPLYPHAAGRLRTVEAPLIVSSSSAFAHGVPVGEGAVHVCYCHSPFRYVWHERSRGLAEVPAPLRPALRAALAGIRHWDRGATEHVTHFIANSQLTRRRIERFWGREATVIHPPVEIDRFRVGPREDYALIVGELVGHKRTELGLEAARRAGLPVKVVGSGPREQQLRAAFADSAEFLGRVDDDTLSELYAGARVVLVPNVEEFGIVAVEAQAAGRPVVAARGGGAVETVVDGVTGVLVEPDDLQALTATLAAGEFDSFETDRIIVNAKRFGPRVFREAFEREVDEAWRWAA